MAIKDWKKRASARGDLLPYEKEGRWVGVQKVKEGFRFYSIKDGMIDHATFKNKADAIKFARNYMKNH